MPELPKDYEALIKQQQDRADRENQQLEENSARLKARNEFEDQMWKDHQARRCERAREFGEWILMTQDPKFNWLVIDGQCWWGLVEIRYRKFSAVLVTGDRCMLPPPIEPPPEIRSLDELQQMFLNTINKKA